MTETLVILDIFVFYFIYYYDLSVLSTTGMPLIANCVALRGFVSFMSDNVKRPCQSFTPDDAIWRGSGINPPKRLKKKKVGSSSRIQKRNAIAVINCQQLPKVVHIRIGSQLRSIKKNRC